MDANRLLVAADHLEHSGDPETAALVRAFGEFFRGMGDLDLGENGQWQVADCRMQRERINRPPSIMDGDDGSLMLYEAGPAELVFDVRCRLPLVHHVQRTA